MKTLILAMLLSFGAHAFALEKCVIKADNPQQPLRTFPWNFFVCGQNAQGWVWLVGISRLSETNYMLQVEYLPTYETEGYLAMHPGAAARFDGPEGQSLSLKVTKRQGTFKDWKKLKVWVDVIGEYQP